MLSFVLYDLNEEKIIPQNIISYEISRDTDAPCDGLRLTFASDSTPDEVYRTEIYNDDELIFSGYADTQREQIDENGRTVFIYARSSACILVDNEAEPRSYCQPSLLSLCEIYAKDFGFEAEFEDVSCSSDYLISKGTSCYDAINNFALGVTGKSIMVNVNGKIKVPDNSISFAIDNENVISEKKVINRGSAVSVIDYKINSDLEYNYHIKSRFMERQKINRKRKINISALPMWQQELTLRNIMNRACESYNCIELVLAGSYMIPLFSRIEYESGFQHPVNDYYLRSCKIIFDSKGERTKLVLNKKTDAEVISYVAE